MKPQLIKAISPADLLDQLADAIKAGKDMTVPLFVSHDGLLCQWVATSLCLYEYKLIVAVELDDLENQANNLRELGFDFFMNTCLWEGFYLQWMCRMNSTGTKVRDAITRVLDEYIPADREKELQLVEDVQAGLQLRPSAQGTHVVTLPFPLSVS